MIRFQAFYPETIDYTLLSSVIFIIGEITVIVLIGLFCLALFLVGLTFYSIRKGKVIFPGFLKAGMVLVEGFSKALFSLFGLEDREMMTFFIRVHNTMSRKSFEAIPVGERAIFLSTMPEVCKMPCKSHTRGTEMHQLRAMYSYRCDPDA